jgi:hypothetical protein
MLYAMKESSKWMFFLPLLYAFHTRMGKGMSAILKWLSEYLIPTFIVALLASKGTFAVWFDYLFMLVLTYTLYEIGYIYNDAYTIKREEHPTRRLNERELTFFYKYEWLIMAFRLFLSSLLSVYIVMKYDYSSSAWLAVGAAWSILLVYGFFNRFRSHVSFLLHALLLLLRYSVPWMLFAMDSMSSLLVLVFFVYPLPNMMENMARNKYGITYAFTKCYMANYEQRYQFRVWYYFVLVTAMTVLLFTGLIPLGYLLIAAYFFVYECFFFAFYGKKRSL